MTRFTALALRPVVYILDFGIALTGAQTFKEARAVTREKLAKILNREMQTDGINADANTHNDDRIDSPPNYMKNI